ncbi:glycosyltransferase [Aliidiomarina minuta]|uniref:glycosyltransferase n=1 Tax=Aliidiomarina minuta TaxID=880057 RepID=UPI0013003E2A|nr:glycosyltransferase [Aliidiomarina minuta]
MNDLKETRSVIVIPCYNRLNTLKRLFNCLLQSEYPSAVDLVFSIDHSNAQTSLVEFIQTLKWPYGELRCIAREQRLGLKHHILQCGDLVVGYEFIVMLEDDLIVSKSFMKYAEQAVQFYAGQEGIAGISLYNYDRSERNSQPFKPLKCGYDAYFMQFASSWGQVWTRGQWQAFRYWLSKNDTENFGDVKADFVGKWPSTSWKKHFIRYMELQNLYFVFPYFGYSTNMGDDGSHHNYIFKLFTSALELGEPNLKLPEVSSNPIWYDSCFRLEKRSETPAPQTLLTANMTDDPATEFYKRFPYRTTFYFRVFLLALLVDAKKTLHKLSKIFKRG